MKTKKEKRPTPPAERPSGQAKELKDIQIHVNKFGQIVKDVQVDDINAFLDANVPDKKFEE
jgi:hypothetical protein